MWIDKYNSEGYYDPTTYQAIRMVLRDELKRRYGTGYRPLVFICSPFAGDIKANTERTKNYCRFAVEQYAIPFAPHLLYPQFMEDVYKRQGYLTHINTATGRIHPDLMPLGTETGRFASRNPNLQNLSLIHI